MMRYKCGHKSETIIMNTTVLGMADYTEWMGSSGFQGDKSLCWNCYIKKMRDE